MLPLTSSQSIISFGDFHVDLGSGELRKHGLRVKLQVQPFQVLKVLLEHHGELVTREELQRRIWAADTFVDFDHGLNNAVKKLREALADTFEKPRFIETLSKRGYRFIAPLTSANGGSCVEEITSRKGRQGVRGWLLWCAAIATVAGLVVAGLLASNAFRVHDSVLATSVPEIQSLAVLPLANLSGDAAQEYFSDGMTDALITDLARIGSLKVISRTSSMQYKQTKKSLPEIARELNVDGIVEGTVQRSGDRVRITAQLIFGPSDKHIWADSYERDMHDVLALERELAGDIAREVGARVTTQSQTQRPQLRAVNPKTLEAYLQGNAHLHRFSRGFGDEELRLASDYFRQAIDADPNFAPAYVGISTAHHWTVQSSRDDVEVARETAQRAVELDPTLSDAWRTLADVKYDFWDWPGAEQDYRRAIALNANNADAHELLGYLLDEIGRPDEAWKECQIAQQLDPNHDHLGYALQKRHEYDQAIKLTLAMLGADPNNGTLHYQLYEVYAAKGMYKEAIQQLEDTWTLFGFPGMGDKLNRAFAASGYMGAMREYAKELEHLHATNKVFLPVNLAAVYAALGDKDRAFHWLEQGYKLRGYHTAGTDIAQLRVYPGLDPLRSDPRFADLVRRMGLQQ